MYEQPDCQFGNVLPKSTILTVAEVAKTFRVSEETVRRWADHWRDSGGQQGLPAFKIGKQWRFHRQAVWDFLVTQRPVP